MKIKENTVVTFHYTVSDREGTAIDSSFDGEPLAMIHGTGYMIKGLENALEDHQAGDKFSVDVKSDDAYGPRHDALVQTMPKEMLASIENLTVGMALRATTDEGEQSVIVIDVTDETVTVDGNHPLAGHDLKFDVEIVEVREASAEELAHGHVHSTNGCDHNH